MSLYILSNYLLYCIINAFTPGPDNILALNTTNIYGWSKGKPLFFGIFAGYFAVQIISGLFVFFLGTTSPELLTIIKYMGIAYILWLAYTIATSTPATTTETHKASFLKGFLLQFVNVKIYIFGITALTGYITPYTNHMTWILAANLCIATIGCIATSSWIAAGLALQRVYNRHFRLINSILALTLLECVYSMW
ncbi:LysE family transporter [uncultured Veillonella sp.]|uniref:LysE family transporter n=1 Tax=uncultured Veillonella sp. TaxID=159268 RepID=UPI002626DC72|nr:LysE family transporter [uncultured Veillonella sp.]